MGNNKIKITDVPHLGFYARGEYVYLKTGVGFETQAIMNDATGKWEGNTICDPDPINPEEMVVLIEN